MNLSVLLMRRRLMMLALNIVLETNETDSFYDTIKGYNGKVAETATLNKQFKQGKWDFICLPFDVNANMMKDMKMNNRVYTLNYTNETEDGSITFLLSEAKKIDAGKGYVINANAPLAAVKQHVFRYVKINTSADSSYLSSASDYDSLDGYNSKGDVELVGTLRAGHLIGDSSYVYFTMMDNKNKLVKLNLTIDNSILAYSGVFRKPKPQT